MPADQRPYALQFLACESAVLDLALMAWILTRPLHRVRLPDGATFPFVLDEIALYVQMTDAIGTFNMQVEMRVPMTQARVFRTPAHVMTFPADRLQVVEEVFYLRNVPFKIPGEFEILLLADGQELRSNSSVRIIVH
jgi:hypothetical protein